jgi:flavocytochrome c
MSEVNLARRGFLKTGAAAAAALMTASAAHAGVPASSVKKWDEEYDVIIVGTGFAGSSCALKAGKAGLKILMIDKMSVAGGNSVICGGNTACPVNPIQKAQGIKDSKELFIADCVKDGLGLNHTELLGTLADRCNETIKMLLDCGCEFQPYLLFEAGHSVPRSYQLKSGSGAGYIHPMHNTLRKMPNVTMRTRCKMDDFVLGDDGAVVGITARTGYRFDPKLESDDRDNKSGTKVTYRAKRGVVLAAGGFSRDVLFRQAQDPRVLPSFDSTNHPGATAGALVSAMGIGALPIQLSWLQFNPAVAAREKGSGVSMNFINHACMDLGIVVDKKTGKRFMDEHAGRKIKSDALFKVIGRDENYPLGICDQSIIDAINPGYTQLALKAGAVKKFDTLDAIADAYGMPKAPFLEQVKKFNGYVKDGKDPEFNRVLTFNKGVTISKAPFYAIEVTPKIHHTCGGLLINTKAQVLSAKTFRPIKGLYAAGEITGGVHGASRLGTVAATDALVFGMIAGEELSKAA